MTLEALFKPKTHLRVQKEKNMTENEFDRSASWNVPEGEYEGTFYEAGEYVQYGRESDKDCFRLVFHVNYEGDGYFDYRAQKRYSIEDGNPPDLSRDLERWLGKEFFEQHPSLQWSDLVGMKARLVIKHVHNPNYSKPYVTIHKILPVRKTKKVRGPILPRIDLEKTNPRGEADASVFN